MNSEEEKVRRTIEKARKPLSNTEQKEETTLKMQKIVRAIVVYSIAAIIVIIFALVMLVLPILLLLILYGDVLIYYDKIFLDYLYPAFKFFKKDSPFWGYVFLLVLISSYTTSLVVMISASIKKHIEIPTVVFFCFILIGCVTLLISVNTKLSDKKEITLIKLETVKTLRNELALRTNTLDKMSKNFSGQIDTAANEIKRLLSENHYNDYGRAIKDQKVVNEMLAIQKATDYMNFADKEQSTAYASVIKLSGTQKQFELDIIALEELNDAQIEELIDQVDTVIRNIEPTANEFVINSDSKRMPMEEIWKKYIQPDQPTERRQ
jgi:hypothetical protein